jgi:hypothetical protein
MHPHIDHWVRKWITTVLGVSQSEHKYNYYGVFMKILTWFVRLTAEVIEVLGNQDPNHRGVARVLAKGLGRLAQVLSKRK